MNRILGDLRYGGRMLIETPGATATVFDVAAVHGCWVRGRRARRLEPLEALSAE